MCPKILHIFIILFVKVSLCSKTGVNVTTKEIEDGKTVGPATVTQDKEVFKSALGMVRVYGGGDCPEKSLGGIQLALDVSAARSYVYVFTDATAGDHRLVGKVLDAVQRKQSQVVFVLTGHCNDLDKPSFKVYQQIASASSGQVFNLNKTSVHKIPVDSTLGEVTVSVSGAKPQITVVDPSGEQLTGPPKLITTLDLSEIMTTTIEFVIEDVQEENVGTYKCFAKNVAGVSKLPTARILSPHTLAASLHTTARIVCQVENSNVVKWVHNDTVLKERDVGGMSTDVLELNVTEDGVWMCVAGRGGHEGDKNITILNGTRHQLVCEVVAKPQPRISWLKDTDEALNHSVSRCILLLTRHQLVCEVVAKPQPRISWLKDTDEALNHSVSRCILLLTRHQLVCEVVAKPQPRISRLKETVEALNHSVSRCILLLTRHQLVCEVVAKPQPRISWLKETVEALNHSVNRCILLLTWHQLVCEVVAKPQPRISWLKETVEALNHSVSRCILLLTRHQLVCEVVAKPQLRISWLKDTDEALNHSVSRCILLLTRHQLVCEVVAKPQPRISWLKDTDEALNHSVSRCILLLTRHQLVCEVVAKPQPRISWLKDTDEALNHSITKATPNTYTSTLTLDSSVDNVEGTYFCHGENSEGTTQDHVQVNVRRKITVVELTCVLDSHPPALITWRHNSTLLHSTENILLADDNSFVSIKRVDFNDLGMYSCKADNGFERVELNVAPKITTKVPTDETPLEILEGQLVELPCEAKGSPKPVVSWELNGLQITDERKFVDEFGLRFVANLTDFGNYTCTVKNQYGNTSITYSVYIWDVLVGDDINLQCDVIGFPIPSVLWVFEEQMLKENTTEISFNDVGNLYIRNATSKHEGSYVCVAENLAGIANKFIHLNINATNLDTALTIACRATGKPKPYIAWSKDDVYLHKDSQYEVGRDGTLTIRSPSEDMSGNYTCAATNKFGIANKTIAVEVYSLPTPQQADESRGAATVLARGGATVACPVRAASGDTLKWYKDAELISTGPLHLSNISRDHQATYACVVSNAVGSAYSTVNVNVEWPPSFVDSDKDETDDKPHNAGTYKCVANNAHGTIHRLFQLNVSVPPFISDFDVMDVSLMEGGVYRCDATNRAGATHIAYRVGVVSRARVQEVVAFTDGEGITVDKSFEAAVGAHIRIACKSSGAPTPSIQWLRNGKLLSENSQYIRYADLILDVETSHAGRYSCVVANEGGSEERAVRLEVLDSQHIHYADLILDVETSHAGRYSCVVANKGGSEERAVRLEVLGKRRTRNTYTTRTSYSTWRLHTRAGIAVWWPTRGARQRKEHANVPVDSGVQEKKVFYSAPRSCGDKAPRSRIRRGQAYYLHCHPLGYPTPAVYWFKDGLPLKLFDDSMVSMDYGEVIAVASATDDQSGNYTCVARNRVGNKSVSYQVHVL
ncbi:putative hemicentin-1, partial [Operophtera brumata]